MVTTSFIRRQKENGVQVEKYQKQSTTKSVLMFGTYLIASIPAIKGVENMPLNWENGHTKQAKHFWGCDHLQANGTINFLATIWNRNVGISTQISVVTISLCKEDTGLRGLGEELLGLYDWDRFWRGLWAVVRWTIMIGSVWRLICLVRRDMRGIIRRMKESALRSKFACPLHVERANRPT